MSNVIGIVGKTRNQVLLRCKKCYKPIVSKAGECISVAGNHVICIISGDISVKGKCNSCKEPYEYSEIEKKLK